MSKDNYDDLADFCGPKDFYDLDGDGHIDAFEAAMMMSDMEDERRSSEQHRSGRTPSYSSGSSGGSHSKEPQGCGCCLQVAIAALVVALWQLFQAFTH